ncbi:hypothetical protein D3C76_1366260 [compost metagenome]
MAADISDLKETASMMNGFLYEKGFIHCFAQRFLTQHIFSGLKSGDTDFCMRVIPSTNADRIDVRVAQKHTVIGINMGYIVLTSCLACSLFVNVTNSPELALWIAVIGF